MADKKISDFTEATSVGATDWIEIETAAGNSRKVKKLNFNSAPVLLDTQSPTGTSVTFDVSTLASGYSFNHLLVRVMGRCDASVTHREIRLTVNSDTGGNYFGSYSEGDAATTTSDFGDSSATSIWAGYVAGASATSGNAGWSEILCLEYAGTTFRKQFQIRGGVMSAANRVLSASGQWNNTAAITGVTVTVGTGGSFITGSKVRLYGIY